VNYFRDLPVYNVFSVNRYLYNFFCLHFNYFFSINWIIYNLNFFLNNFILNVYLFFDNLIFYMFDWLIDNTFDIYWLFDNVFDVFWFFYHLYNLVITNNFSWHLYNLFNVVIYMYWFLYYSLIVSFYYLRNFSFNDFFNRNLNNTLDKVLLRNVHIFNYFFFINLNFGRLYLVRVRIVADILLIDDNLVIFIDFIFNNLGNWNIYKSFGFSITFSIGTSTTFSIGISTTFSIGFCMIISVITSLSIIFSTGFSIITSYGT